VQHALFYDLSSFTSNCAAQREFLAYLSRFVDGLPFKIQDSRFGEEDVDFGEVVRTYADCNIQPEYSTGDLEHRGIHGTAGFLGVYGNIATCTFLHGAFLLQLSSPKKCGCAGDDAVLVSVYEDSTIWACVSLIGIIAKEKTFSTQDPDVVYLKRRTWIDEPFCRLVSSSYVQLPSFLFLVSPHDRRRWRESSLSEQELRELAISSLSAFFKSVVPYKDSDTFSDIRYFARKYYQLLGIPVEGNVPQFSTASRKWYRSRFIPSVAYLGEYDFITGTIESTYPGWCLVPDNNVLAYPLPIRLVEGDVVSLVQSKNVSLLRKMGVLEPVFSGLRRLFGDDGLNTLLDLYKHAGEESNFKKYRVIKDISDVPCPPEVIGEVDHDMPYREVYGALDDFVLGKLSVSYRCAEYRLSHPRCIDADSVEVDVSSSLALTHDDDDMML
jgi:hypothetical protein